MPVFSQNIAAFARLAVILAGVGVVGFGLTVFLMAMALLKPPRMGAGKAMYFLRRLAPDDLGLPYETLQFQVSDRPFFPSPGTPGEGQGGGLSANGTNPHLDPPPEYKGRRKEGKTIRIAAWWIPAEGVSDRLAILIHGFSDAKVGGIAWAPLMRLLGFHVLAIDLRAHGESQGKYSTAGYLERHDLNSIIDQIKRDRPVLTRQVVLFGVSLGAATVAAAAVLRDDLAAVILDSPYANFPNAVLSHADKLGVPGRTFQRAALWLAQRLAGAKFDEVRPVDTIPRIVCPLWLVQSMNDPFIPDADLQAVAAAMEARSKTYSNGSLWQVADCHHVIALSEHPEEYRRRLTEFLAAANLVSSNVQEPAGR